MKERLFLNGIALHSTDVSPGNVELPSLIESDFTNSCVAFSDWATVSTGIAAEAIALDGFVQFAFADILIQNFAEG